jgi:hypothetical protein
MNNIAKAALRFNVKNVIKNNNVFRYACSKAASNETVDFLGLQTPRNIEKEDGFARHRKFLPVGDKAPYVAYDAFVAPNATVTGRVGLLEASSVSIFLHLDFFIYCNIIYIYILG